MAISTHAFRKFRSRVDQTHGGSQQVLQQSDFSYVGCFGLFNTEALYMAFAYGTGTARVVGGFLQFLVTAGVTDYDSAILEFRDPGTYSTNFATAPRSENVRTYWGLNPYGSNRRSWDSFGNDRVPNGNRWYPGNLYWHEANQLLYYTYWDTYNTTGFQDWGLGAASLDNPSTQACTPYGPWRISCTDGDGNTWYGPHRAMHLGLHPITGKMTCASTLVSGNAASPWGPDYYEGLDFPTPSTPSGQFSATLHQPNRYLEHYYQAHTEDGHYTAPLRNFRRRSDLYIFESFPTDYSPYVMVDPANYSGVGAWTAMDVTTSHVYLNLTNKRGLIYPAQLVGSATTTDPLDGNAGHMWYENPTNHHFCPHGFDAPTNPITGMPEHAQGPVSRAQWPAFIIYDPNDLEAVKNTSSDYTVEPSSVINLESQFGIHCAPEGITGGVKNISFCYFDTTRNYLFLLAQRADVNYIPGYATALMHVFHVQD